MKAFSKSFEVTFVSLNGIIATFLYTPFDTVFHPLQKIIKSIFGSIKSVKSIKGRRRFVCKFIFRRTHVKVLGPGQEYVSLAKCAV